MGLAALSLGSSRPLRSILVRDQELGVELESMLCLPTLTTLVRAPYNETQQERKKVYFNDTFAKFLRPVGSRTNPLTAVETGTTSTECANGTCGASLWMISWLPYKA